MENDQFEDIGVLACIANLHKSNILHIEDLNGLIKCLKSDWGRNAANSLLTNNKKELKIILPTLRKYSNVFNKF